MSVVYTPIRLEIIPAILDGDTNAPLDNRQYLITITAPLIHNPGRQQALPSKITRKLILGERLDLKLLPTDHTIPRGKYTVSYADVLDPTHPFTTEEWVVPQPPKLARVLLKISPASLIYDLPENFYSLSKVEVSLNTLLPEYTISGNTIIFSTAPVEQTVIVTYGPILTRAQVVYLPATWQAVPNSRRSLESEFLSSY